MPVTKEVSNSDDIIDSRDVIARLDDLQDDLESEHSDYEDDEVSSEDDESEKTKKPFDDWVKATAEDSAADLQDEAKEYLALKKLQDEAEGYCDWTHGATLIRRTHFKDYCKELVADIGDMPKDLPSYIENNINWDGVADDLEADYTTVEFDGVEYLVRE